MSQYLPHFGESQEMQAGVSREREQKRAKARKSECAMLSFEWNGNVPSAKNIKKIMRKYIDTAV